MKFVVLIFLLAVSISGFSQEEIDQVRLLKDYARTLQKINNFLEENPSAALYYQKGLLLREKFDYSASLMALTKACELEKENAFYWSELADMHSLMGNSIDAINIYKQLTATLPVDLTLNAKLGRLLINQLDYKGAYRIFTEIRQTDSTNVIYNKQLAIAAFRLGKSKEAISLFRNVLNQNQRDYGSYLNLATLLQQDTAFTQANIVIDNGLHQFPGDAALLLRKAQNHYLQGDYVSAVSAYETYLANNDTVFNVRKEYGVSLFLTKNEQKALAILQPALHIAPNDPIIALYVGLCYKALKDFKNSKNYLELAGELAIPPYLSSIFQYRGQVHGLLREFTQAIEMYMKALELDPVNHELLFELATTYEEFYSDKTRALNFYQQYLNRAGYNAPNTKYARARISKLKEKQFFGQ